MLFKKKNQTKSNINTIKNDKNTILVYSPVDGKVKDLSKVSDPVFAQKMIGDGVAIEPKSGDFYAPLEGNLKVAFETGHAFGIVSKLGPEILLHIGIDTVNLKGQGFNVKQKVGNDVSKDTLLTEVDLEVVSKKAPSTDTVILVTNETMGDFKVTDIAKGEVKKGDLLFKLVK